MRRTKGVVDIDLVAQAGECLSKGVVVFLFLLMEAQVLQYQHVAVLHRTGFGLRRVANAVVSKVNRLAQQC
jgi:hypothetical protein